MIIIEVVLTVLASITVSLKEALKVAKNDFVESNLVAYNAPLINEKRANADGNTIQYYDRQLVKRGSQEKYLFT